MAVITTINPKSINLTGNYVVNSINASANVVAGNIKTDNLLYSNGSPYVFTTSANGQNTQIQFNDSGSFAGNANLTFNKTTGTLTVAYISGNGSALSSVTGSNVAGQVGNALVAGTVYTSAQPNITSVGTLTSLSVTGNISAGNIAGGNLVNANYISGNGSLLTNLTGANVTGFVPNANIANAAYSVDGSNISGQVGNALVAGTVYTSAQPNITSVGILSGLVVNGNIVPNANITYSLGNSTNRFKDLYLSGTTITVGTQTISSDTSGISLTGTLAGDGGNLSNITGANVTGQVGNSLIAGTVYTSAQPNITSVGSLISLTVTGNITSGNVSGGNLVSANYISGNGSLLTSLTGANVTGYVPNANIANTAYAVSGSNVSGQVSNSLIAGTVYTASQPNITSLGTLTGLTVSGDSTLTGNLTVSGTFEYANVTTFRVKDPIIEQGGNTAGGALTSNDGYDRGQLLHYYSGSAVDAFMGWDNSNAEFAFGSNVSVSSEVVTFNTFGNVRAGYFIGNGSQLTGLTSLSVANSNYANYAGNVVNSSQPNITSVGTLSSLTVGGTISVSAIGNLYIPGGTANYVIKTDGAGNLSWVAQTSAGNANISGSNTQIFFNDAGNTSLGASANLTFNKSTNTLTTTNLVVSGTTNLGAVGNVTLTGGSSNNYLKTDGAGTLSWVSLPSTTLSVDTFTGNGVQTAFTLSVTPTSKNYTIAVVAGIVQPRSTYSVSGTTLTFSEAPPNTSSVEVTTINSGVSVASGGGGGGTGLTYQGISANTTLVAGNSYIVNTSSANLTLTLPASSTLGDLIGIIDGTGTASTHQITITGANIMGSSSDMVVTTNRAAFQIVYYNATQGWLLTNV